VNNDQRRLYLAVALCAGLLFIWQKFYAPKNRLAPQVDGGAGQIAQQVVDGGAPLPGAVMAAPSTPTPQGERPKEELVEFDGPTRHLTFSSYGGALKSAVLKGEQFKRIVDGKDVQVDLVNIAPAQALPFSTTLGKGFPDVPANQAYAVQQTADGVTFTTVLGPLTVTKRYTVPRDGYDVALEVQIQNAGAGSLTGELGLSVTGFVPPGSEDHGGGITGFLLNRGPSEARLPIARVGTDVKRQSKDKDGAPEVVGGEVSFAGLDEHYFLAVAYPVKDKAGKVTLSTPEDGLRHADLTLPTTVAPGASVTRTLGLYLGPKLQEDLENAGASIAVLHDAKPELKHSVDYGLMAVIALALLSALRVLNKVVPNWGVDILLLTLGVKILTLPLTMKQMGSAENMRKLQPEIEKIKAKYKDDKERQNAETMKLYQQSGVNPMAGCLPLIIQMPIFWGLYRTLALAFDLYRQPFVHGWINDLSGRDPSYILPILLIVSMFVSQRMMPPMGDPAQQKMMQYVMPLMFGSFMIGLPAGLSLYYAFNNLLNIAQQLYLRKRFPAARPPVDAGKKKLATS
jgi:YidC/Oxa1 family membrane protein insertase